MLHQCLHECMLWGEQGWAAYWESTEEVALALHYNIEASLMAQWVKNRPARQETQETWVPSLGWEDPLEKKMTNCSSVPAWRIPTKELAGYST